MISLAVQSKILWVLQERNFGDVRGTAYDDLGFDLFAPDFAPLNGETWQVFHARVDRAWEAVRALAAATSGTLAVVTHGLVCKSLAGRYLNLGPGVTAPERWENTSLTVVEGSVTPQISEPTYPVQL